MTAVYYKISIPQIRIFTWWKDLQIAPIKEIQETYDKKKTRDTQQIMILDRVWRGMVPKGALNMYPWSTIVVNFNQVYDQFETITIVQVVESFRTPYKQHYTDQFCRIKAPPRLYTFYVTT